MNIAEEILLEKEDIALFKREKCQFADSCKLLLHYPRADGTNIRHQYIYETSNGELRNFVFITNKDNFTIPYRNYLGEIFTSKDTPLSSSMEPMCPEIKLERYN
jgi:hypothetical protein